jgi:subtilase family serine protease
MRRRTRPVFRPELDRLDDRCLPSVLIPAQVTSAYGLNTITYSVNGRTIKGNGAGEDIAIVDAYHDPYIVADLYAFDQTFGLPNPPIGVVDLAGTSTNDGWAEEEALDVEWVHAIAPGAEIIVVEAKSDSIGDLLTAVNVARNLPGIVAVSMSWGASGFAGQSSLDAYFTTPAGHTGITFIAASGDEGSAGGAEWPASSANVLSVGGTTLRVSSSGTYQGESLWSGSSGGYSYYVPEPSYQYSLQSTGRLMTPDVAFDGDPNTGVYVLSIAPSTGAASWLQVGGTSLGAPAWTAIIAIADQGRALAGLGSTLDGPSQTLPTLFSLPASDFHKIASLSSGFFRSSTVTAGLGTPNGAALVYGLAYGTTTTSLRGSIVAATSTAKTVSPSATTLGQVPAATSRSSIQSRSSTVAVPAVALPASLARLPGVPQDRDGSFTTLWKSFLDAFGID